MVLLLTFLLKKDLRLCRGLNTLAGKWVQHVLVAPVLHVKAGLHECVPIFELLLGLK